MYRLHCYQPDGLPTLTSAAHTRDGIADVERAIAPYVDCHDGRGFLFTGYAIEEYVDGIGWCVQLPDDEGPTVADLGVW